MPLRVIVGLLLQLQQASPQRTPAAAETHWFQGPAVVVGGYTLGLLGLALTFLSWRAGRRTSRVYAHLFELAERNIDKTTTEEQLRARKKEVEAASERIEELQRKIRREIPIEAKRAVLLDRLNHQVEALQNTLTAVTRIRTDLLAIGATPQLPPELLKAVQSEISPEYVLDKRRRNLQVAVTIVMTFAGLTAAILPYFSMARWASGVFLGIGFLLSLALVWSYARQWRRPPKHAVFAAVSALWFAIGVFASVIYAAVYRDLVTHPTLPAFEPIAAQRDPFQQLLPLLALVVAAFVAGIVCLVVARLASRRRDVRERPLNKKFRDRPQNLDADVGRTSGLP